MVKVSDCKVCCDCRRGRDRSPFRCCLRVIRLLCCWFPLTHYAGISTPELFLISNLIYMVMSDMIEKCIKWS
jgi:uncharacterized hydantoinase/oxoprolinase family protein